MAGLSIGAPTIGELSGNNQINSDYAHVNTLLSDMRRISLQRKAVLQIQHQAPAQQQQQQHRLIPAEHAANYSSVNERLRQAYLDN